ncbi:ABC transporter family substrate-binding protein [Actinosynnema sp. NPDC047251]|uniref:ABC-type transporter, substrate-binding lipoprotein, family 5 n=1 Tax=Saccharothrix espanaensis (strain ATCC 51144 / DSM 44229 / JCM 9112 / NBRC 15066 / NRRL 15764) TaxID=1179773 RepID=K0K4M5_SACES|nr:ABC transporter family substrate-binding protein [Saccharothrix espanaensis]CCH32542.1 ABC-type transporter, substrate-binding lipoprotein, family 5 [Saccharothrix espanaensis DSM 44229]
MNRRRMSGVLAVALAVSACTAGSPSGGDTTNLVRGDANTVNTGTAKQGGTITYVLERNIVNWNPLGADIGVATQLVADVYDPAAFVTLPDLKTVELNKDLLVSAEQTSESPQTLVYRINPKAVWNDGTPITAADFDYVRRASTPATCPTCEAAHTMGYEDITSLTGTDDGRTVTVTFSRPFGDWKSLFGPILPAHVARKLGDDGTPEGLAKSFNEGFRYQDSFPDWSGGPFMFASWETNQAATLVPNPKWWGAPVTLERLVFRVVTDTSQEVPALQNGEVQIINPDPQVDLLRNVQALGDVKYQLVQGLRKQMVLPNLNNPAMRDPALRKALFTAMDVGQTIGKTVGQFSSDATPLRNRIYVPQQPGYKDNLGTLGTGDIAKAKSILTEAGYKVDGDKLIDPQGTPVPTLTMRYIQNNQILQTVCQLFADSAKQLGVTVDVQTTDSIGATVTHQAGKDFDLFAMGWIGQTFVASQYSQAFKTKAGLNFGGYSSPVVDELLTKALGATDEAEVAEHLNAVDAQLTEDAYILPLYQVPDLLAYKANLVNVRANGTYNGPPYNAGQWGIAG